MIIERDMALNRQEFLRILPRALVGQTWQLNEQLILIEWRNETIKIELGEERVMQVAKLTIPRLLLRFILPHDSDELRQWLVSFERHYFRGGG